MSFIEIVGNDDPYVRDGVERNEEVHQKARIFIQAFREKFKECHDDVFPMCYAAKLKKTGEFCVVIGSMPGTFDTIRKILSSMDEVPYAVYSCRGGTWR
jgi:hypothetical protein